MQGLVFGLRQKLNFPLCSILGELFRAFLKTFWGYFLTINCRLLNILQLLYLAQTMIIRFSVQFHPFCGEAPSYGTRRGAAQDIVQFYPVEV